MHFVASGKLSIDTRATINGLPEGFLSLGVERKRSTMMTELTFHFSPLMLYILSYLPTAFKKEDFLSFFCHLFF